MQSLTDFGAVYALPDFYGEGSKKNVSPNSYFFSFLRDIANYVQSVVSAIFSHLLLWTCRLFVACYELAGRGIVLLKRLVEIQVTNKIKNFLPIDLSQTNHLEQTHHHHYHHHHHYREGTNVLFTPNTTEIPLVH